MKGPEHNKDDQEPEDNEDVQESEENEDYDHAIKDLMDKIKEKWNLPHPNLAISLMGGAWDFPVNDHVKEVFRKGIIKSTVGTSKDLFEI